jgi:hypothetical protein
MGNVLSILFAEIEKVNHFTGIHFQTKGEV